jgi:hypothetical protein
MARITSDQEIVPGDSVSKYPLLSNRHDGRGAIHLKFTPVRVVCRNTLNQALEHGPTLRVAHTLSMKESSERRLGSGKTNCKYLFKCPSSQAHK